MKMVEPMKKWTVSYNGEMVHQATGQKFNVCLEVRLSFYFRKDSIHILYLTMALIIFKSILSFQGEYKSELSYFDFDSDMDPWTIVRAFAKESWSREYFDKIKR